jgi:hypothetical protein
MLIPILLLSAEAFSSDSTLVLTEIMVDPTPSWGCPSEEYVELFNPGPGAVDLSAWSLEIGTSSRSLGAGMLDSGAVALVFDDGDSALFSGLPGQQIILSSLPALSNGGGRVALHGPGGLQDAMEHAGQAQNGRAWERLRASDCGALSNWRTSGSSCGSPGHFSSSSSPEPNDPSSPSFASDLLSGPLSTRHWLPRSATSAELLLDAPTDPIFRPTVQAVIAGFPASVLWLADDKLQFQWSARLPPGPAHIAIGPLRACHASAQAHWISGSIERHSSPRRGELVLTEILADPIATDPYNPSEAFELWNASARHLELGGLRWATHPNANSHAAPASRIILAPGRTAVFYSDSIDNWPTLANNGGTLIILAQDGSPLIEAPFGPCMQPDPTAVGEGLSIRRVIGPTARQLIWQASSPSTPSDWGRADFSLEEFGARLPQLPDVCSFGLYDGLLTVTFADAPALSPALWPLDAKLDSLTISDGWWSGAHWHSYEAAAALQAEPAAQELRWGTLFSSPLQSVELAAAQPSTPSQLRIEELLFDALPSGREFLEIINQGDTPIDLIGLQVATGAEPSPADWYVLCDASIILMPGHVMAFSSCPLQAAAPYDASGAAVVLATGWPALSDGGGSLSIRGETGEALDYIEWSPEALGPWHEDTEGWSLERVGPGPNQWRSCPQGASPGAPSLWSQPPAASPGAPAVAITFSGAWINPLIVADPFAHTAPTSHSSPGLEVNWNGGNDAFFMELSISDPMSGAVVARPLAALVEARGRYFWDGRGFRGAALSPGVYAVSCRWSGPQGAGKKQSAVGLSYD